MTHCVSFCLVPLIKCDTAELAVCISTEVDLGSTEDVATVETDKVSVEAGYPGQTLKGTVRPAGLHASLFQSDL